MNFALTHSMSRSHPVFAVPKRLTLSGQAADSLRAAIAAGTWQEFLPSERRLCEIFQISRPTVRTALHLLAKDGLIDIRQGRRNRLLCSPLDLSRCKNRVVGLIMSHPVSQMTLPLYQGIGEMRSRMAEQGFATEVLICSGGSAQTQCRKLEEFVHQNGIACCVLLSVGKVIQQWCSSRGLPALVVGSCHPEVKLPSVDIDQRSVCRHAAGVFLARGHRHLALVVPDSEVAGDLASEDGFLEAVLQHSPADNAKATVVRHDGTSTQICAKLHALLSSAEPPTALLVAKPHHAFIVLIHLLKHGVAVPDRVSFIARDQHPVFETVNPVVTHYSTAEEAFANRFSRLMLQMVTQGNLSPDPSLVFPRFISGGTVRAI